jgi:hypothetical protein
MQKYLMLMQVVCIITTVISRVSYSILFNKVAEAATFIGHVPASNLSWTCACFKSQLGEEISWMSFFFFCSFADYLQLNAEMLPQVI